MDVAGHEAVTHQRHGGSDRVVLTMLARVDAVALGAAVGVVSGLGIFVATIVLILGDGEPVGPNLSLLAEYLIGYAVTPAGSIVGLLYGAASGFVLGWLVAALRNAIVSIYLSIIRLRASLTAISRVIDPD